MLKPVIQAVCLGGSLSLSTIAQTCGGTDDDPPPGSEFIEYDVVHYEYQFDLETGAATATVELAALSDGNCIVLDDRTTETSTPQIDGVDADWYALGNDLLQLCGQPFTAGDVLQVSTSTTVPVRTYNNTDVGYSIKLDAGGGPFQYLLGWIEGCSLFGPCYDDPDDFATYAFEVSHPLGTQVLCPGTLTPGDTLSACDFTYDGPTYSSFALMASTSWQKVTLGTLNGVAIELYDFAALDAAGQVDENTYLDYLQGLEDLFGPYPYGDTLRFVMGPTSWWGFEHPGNVALSTDLLNAKDSYQDPLLHTLMHETAHQWAGDRTTLAGVYDFVWKEAMAEYLTFVYEDENLPPAYPGRTLQIWVSNGQVARFYPVPEEEPDLFDYYSDVYGVGPMVLFRQLEALFGREPILAAMQAALASPGLLSVADLQIALEDATGADLAEYFDEWVFGQGVPDWPELAVSYSDADGDGTYEIQITQVQGNGVVYGFKSALRLMGGAQSEVADVPFSYGVDGTAASLTLTAAPGFTVTDISIDPYREALVMLEGRALSGERFEFRPL